MTSKTKQIAKQLFKLSVIDEKINEKRVNEIVSTLVTRKPLHYVQILQGYKNAIENFLTSQEIIIEVPKGFTMKDTALKSTKRVVVKENPKIVYGVRIIDGDWVFDNTLEGKLENIVTSIGS